MFVVMPGRLRFKRIGFVLLAVYWSASLYYVLAHNDWRSSMRLRKAPRERAWWPDPTSPLPPPPERAGEDAKDSVDPLYRPFHPHSPHEADPLFPRLRPTRFLPPPCLESWLVDGELAPECDAQALGDEDKLDVIWLWVNGSDGRWAAEVDRWSAHHGIKSGARHFREQDELRYSMRSVLASLAGGVRTFHLVLYDYAFDTNADARLLPESTIHRIEEDLGVPASPSAAADKHRHLSLEVAAHLQKEWRVVQTPRWLDFSATNPAPSGNTTELPRLRYAGHSEIFHLPTLGRDGRPLDAGEQRWREREWKAQALPTYNSMAIESRLGFLPGLGETAVAFNDDFFLLRPLSVSDFNSPLYGNVLRYKLSNNAIPVQIQNHLIHSTGEVGGLFHANWILSKRFPARGRPYVEHVPKVITRALADEATLMFGESITNASSKRFRELHVGLGDVQTQWLQGALRVERWREALLWTWIVAKLGALGGGGGEGTWGPGARGAVADLFQRQPGRGNYTVEVVRGPRRTLEKGRVAAMFGKAGWAAPKGINILFSSLDGHMQTTIAKPGPEYTRCTIDLQQCFGAFWTEGEDTTAAHVFKHVAFRVPECGDCLIMALVSASGPLGLSAFFPPPNATYTVPARTPAPDYIPPPHLPLTRTWDEADFSLAAVLAPHAGTQVNLREWTLRLLSRYIYSHAQSGVEFHQLKTPQNTRDILGRLDRGRASVVCLNDDIEQNYTEVVSMVGDWFEKRWPTRAVWERERGV